MRYHDFDLSKYEVSDYGKTIILYLVYECSDAIEEQSVIKFSDVTIYNFTHTVGSIITDIEEVPINDIVAEVGYNLAEWNRMYSLSFWSGTAQNYVNDLQENGYKAWRICSAIGFYGFVIAKEVMQVQPN